MVSINSVGASALLFGNQRVQENALREIASGSRLNSAGDGAADLAIATALSSDNAVLSQAAVNTSQGVSVAQVAEGGLARISDGLTRLKELAAQSGNGALSDSSRAAINSEFVQIREEISEIARTTSFNGQPLLDNNSTLKFQAGSAAGDTISLDTVDASTASLGINGASVATAADAAAALDSIDQAIDQVAGARAEIGGTIGRFEVRAENIATQQEALSAARSAIQDSDIAAALTRSVSAGIQLQSEAYSTAQANKSAQQLLRVLA